MDSALHHTALRPFQAWRSHYAFSSFPRARLSAFAKVLANTNDQDLLITAPRSPDFYLLPIQEKVEGRVPPRYPDVVGSAFGPARPSAKGNPRPLSPRAHDPRFSFLGAAPCSLLLQSPPFGCLRSLPARKKTLYPLNISVPAIPSTSTIVYFSLRGNTGRHVSGKKRHRLTNTTEARGNHSTARHFHPINTNALVSCDPFRSQL